MTKETTIEKMARDRQNAGSPDTAWDMLDDDIIVPRSKWQAAIEAFEEMVVASKTVEQPVPPIAPTPPAPDPEHELYVDLANGHDGADGGLVSPIRTFSRMAEMLKPRTLVIVLRGYYREPLRLINLAEKLRSEPVWIKSEEPGAATLTATHGLAASGQAEWKDEGDGVYSISSNDTWAGFAAGRFLFKFKSEDDLRARSPIMGINKPDYGIACERGRAFVRLPARMSPNGKSVIFPGRRAQHLAQIVGTPNVILDGFRLAGAGQTFAVDADERSSGLVIRNCTAELCRMLARIPSDSLIEWCVYRYPGFLRWAEEIANLNGGSIEAVFDLVKTYRGGDYEGRLATGAGIATGCRFEYNLIGPAFDGKTTGQFSDAISIGNVTMQVVDDGDEMEDWADRPSRNLVSVGNFTIDAFGADVSIQPKNRAFEGPATFRREVYIKRHPLARPPYNIKIMGPFKGAPEAIFDHCFFHNVRGPSGWGDKNWLYLDDEKARGLRLTITNSVIVMPDGIDLPGKFKPELCDYNCVVADRAYPELQGPNGIFVETVEALGLVDFAEGGIDVRPTEGSPLVGAGRNGGTIGPYEVGDRLLPRPMEEAWHEGAPALWSTA